MDNISQALASALQLRRAGNRSEAERLCREIIAREPAQHAALDLLGISILEQGRAAEAVEVISRALHLAPNNALYLIHRGAAYAALQQWGQAADSFRRAAAVDPNSADAHYNLGTACGTLRQWDEAAESLRRAVVLRPNSDAHFNLGIAYAALKRWSDAADSLRRAIAANPRSAHAHFHLGVVHQSAGQTDDAIACLQQALQIDPQMIDAHNNLGVALQSAGQFDEALQSISRALAIEPKFAIAHNNLGLVLLSFGRYEEAQRSCRDAIRLAPDLADAHSNLARALQAAGRIDEALASFGEAIRLQPDHAEAQFSRSFILLSRGDFTEGWVGYEWRLKCKDYRDPKLREPLWDGSELAGRTLLVHAEQGLGDILQFIRYVPIVRQRGGRVLVAMPQFVLPLLTASGYQDDLLGYGSPIPKFDVQAPLMSLPRILRTTVEAIPNHVPYLAADPQLADKWRRRLEGYTGFKIGITWQGNPRFLFDRVRSIPLTAFQPLAEVPGVRLFSLQKGPGCEQIAAAAEQVPLVDLGPELDRDGGVFMDTAAVMKNLDLVIAPDTAPAHLAGALGVPIWLALGCYPEWRWLYDREDSPWYPTMRLFRQQKPGEWADVFHRMAAALAPLVA